MRCVSMAVKARRRLARRGLAVEPAYDDDRAAEIIAALDSKAVSCGRVVLFSDGSALSLKLRWRKGGDGLYHWIYAYSAHTL